MASRSWLPGLLTLALGFPQSSYGAHARWPMDFDIDAVPGVSSIVAVASTPDGFIWLGSPRGLCRWDGSSVRCFDGSDTRWKAFDSGGVNALATTSDGRLWIGSDRGLFIRNSTNEIERQKSGGDDLASPEKDKILAMLAAGAVLWVASSRGLHRLNQGSWRYLPWPEPGLGWKIEEMDTDRGGGGVRLLVNGQVWISNRQGSELLRHTLPLVAADPRAGAAHRPRAAWVGAIAAHWPRGAPDVFGGLLDRHGRIWISTYDGVFTRDSATPPPGERLKKLPATAFIKLLEDAQDNIWTIGFGSSLFRISSPRRTSILGNEGKGGDAAFAVARAPDGTVYVTTEHGLSIYTKGEHRRITPAMGLPSYAIRSLAIDGRNQVWMTTLADGIIKWDGSAFTQYGRASGLSTNEWRSIGAAGDSVWASANDGSVIHMNALDGEWKRVDGLDHKCLAANDCPARIRAIEVAPRGGRVWFCSEGRGVFVMDTSAGDTMAPIGGLPEAGVNYIKEDERGIAWAATEQGLYRVDGKRTTSYGGATDMPQQPLLQIADAALSNGEHDMWLGTKAGILRVSRRELDEVAEGRSKTLSVRGYRVADGLATDEIIGDFHPGSLADARGLVWFASVRGLVVFDAAFSQPHPPSIAVESVMSHGRMFSATDWRSGNLLLPAGTRDLDISYVAPAYIDPKRMAYSYRLAGLDTGWTAAGARQTAYYTQLKPGTYQFIVEARAEDGRGTVPRQTMSLTIPPFFYQTRAFAAVLFGFALALTAMAMKLRTRRMAARFNALAEERARIARDFHDTLGQVFSASGLQLDALERTPPGDPAFVNRIRRVKQTLAHGKLAARRALWNVRRAGDATAARRPFRKTLQDLGALYEEVSLVVTSDGQERDLPRAAEDAILRIAEEAVSNAVAHGHAQRVSIDLQYQPDSFALWVRDDGAGFNASRSKLAAARQVETSGLGLVGMEERASTIGATFHVHSEPGVGSEIGVVLPVSERGYL